MRHARPRAERALIESVERCQPARIEFAEDHALGKTIHRAEAEPQRKLLEPFAHQTLVARAEHGQPVAHHDPVDGGVIHHPALAARIAHHVREVAGAGDREGHRIDRAEHVEIDKAVVKRRDQRIGHRMREPHEIAVVTRRIDNDEIMGVFDRVDRGGEIVELRRFVVRDQRAVGARYAVMRRQFEIEPGMLRPGLTVFDVMGEALLARVEVDRGDPLASLQQRDRDMHRDR